MVMKAPPGGLKGFPDKKDSGRTLNESTSLKDGFRKLDYQMDPHDLERNPKGGLKEKTQSNEDLVDHENDRDTDDHEYTEGGL